MNREKIMLGVLVVLGVYAVLHYTVLNAPPDKGPAAAGDPSQDPLMKIIAVRGAIPKIPKEEVLTDYTWGKDLFATTATIGIEAEEDLTTARYRLTGIELSESSAAIINGEPVNIGSFIEGYEVIEITRNQVILYRNLETLVLTLGNGGSSVREDDS